MLSMGRPASLSDQLTYDPARVADRVQQIRAEQGPIRPEAALRTAISLLAQSTLARSELVLVSDFQRSDWLGPTAPQRQRLRELLDSTRIRPALTLWKMDPPSIDNIYVAALELSQVTVGTHQPLRVQALLRNLGRRSYEDLRVHFRVDGAHRK